MVRLSRGYRGEAGWFDSLEYEASSSVVEIWNCHDANSFVCMVEELEAGE